MRVLGEYALVLITGGAGYYQDANGCARALSEGDVLLIFPELAHAYGPQPACAFHQCYTVFSGPFAELLDQTKSIRSEQPILHAEPIAYWAEQLQNLLTSVPHDNVASALVTIGKFSAFLTELIASDLQSAQSETKAWLSASRQLLSEPSPSGWRTPQKVAQDVGLSYENFRKRFVREAGESPGQFQKRRRIDRACAIIYQSNTTFQELADQLGFCDAYHFSKVFRQVTGETPSAYRKRVHGD